MSWPDAASGPAAIVRVVEVPFETGEVLIGRQPGVAIELPFAAVSGRHARLFRVGAGYCVEDLASANGTFLGGRRLSPHASEPIAVGESIGIAGVEVLLDGELGASGPGRAAEGTATLARRLVQDLYATAPPAECARLVVVGGPALGRELALPGCGRVFRVGRGENCDFVLPDEDISREHAAFVRDADGIVVCDLGSKNGVEVGGERLVGERRLCDGDLVRIGETQLRVVNPEERYLRQLQTAEAQPKSDEEEPARGEPSPGADKQRAALMPLLVPSVVLSEAAAEPRSSRLPLVATAVAAIVLSLLAWLVLTLAFAP